MGSTRMKIDLNCDMGEGFGPWVMGHDSDLLECVTSANIACGFHAGDPMIMLETCRRAVKHGVAIGAHPGFDDKQGFGRRRILGLSSREVETLVAYQIGALQAVARLAGGSVTHVKAHGALSNMACEDERMASAIARAIHQVDRELVFVVMPFTELETAGKVSGLTLVREVFADRGYEDNGLLMPRHEPGAVLQDEDEIADRVLEMVRTQSIPTRSGRTLRTPIDTICLHGDTPGALTIAHTIRSLCREAGVAVKAFV